LSEHVEVIFLINSPETQKFAEQITLKKSTCFLQTFTSVSFL